MADLSLKRFLEELAGSLAELSDGEVRAVLLRYAAALAPGARQEFLTDFQAAKEVLREGGARGEDRAGSEDGEALLADIDALAADLAAGVYFDGYDWDSYERRERAFGDESWAPRMDGLFSRVDAVFLRGEPASAREAYARLFETLALEGDEGGPFSGEEAPADMLHTDVTEAGARYLRVVYHSHTDPAERARELGGVWLERLPYGRAPHSLTAVREALPQDLPGLAEFWPHWTAYLIERSAAATTPAYQSPYLLGSSLLHELVTEAALAAGGIDGLGEVARAGGVNQADAYLAWIDALRQEERAAEAEQVCREALEAAPIPSVRDFTIGRWAVLAERAALLAQRRGDGAAECAYRERAWELAPEVRRMCALFAAAERHRPGSGPAVAGRLAERRRTGRNPGNAWSADHLTVQALLLADRLDDALDLLPARVDAPGDVTGTVLPYALAAASGAAQRPEWPSTTLHTLIFAQGEQRLVPPAGEAEQDALPPHLGALLCELLTHRRPDPARRERRLRAGRAGADLAIKRIVGGQHRRSYPWAARLAIACAEALACAGEDSFYLESVRGGYPRHIAFRRELDAAQADSPLL